MAVGSNCLWLAAWSWLWYVVVGQINVVQRVVQHKFVVNGCAADSAEICVCVCVNSFAFECVPIAGTDRQQQQRWKSKMKFQKGRWTDLLALSLSLSIYLLLSLSLLPGCCASFWLWLWNGGERCLAFYTFTVTWALPPIDVTRNLIKLWLQIAHTQRTPAVGCQLQPPLR